jgi:putative ABC transport system permease protein
MTTSPWRLGWRTLWRDLRAGELRLLVVAVTLAVAALTAVGFFADRLKGGLARDARQLLGGDTVVVSDNPTPAAFADKARALGLRTATTTVFPTMARAPDAQGGASAAGGPEGRRARVSAARQPHRGAQAGRAGRHHARRAGAGRGVGRQAPAGGAGAGAGRPAAAGRRAAAHRPRVLLEPDRGTGFSTSRRAC